MKHHFELFTKSIGLLLVCAGLLLGSRSVSAWLEPAPDFSFLADLMKHSELPEVARKPFEALQRSLAGEPGRRALRLLVEAVFPVCLGLLLLLRSRRLADLCYRDPVPPPGALRLEAREERKVEHRAAGR
jgi:hypothetical protein